MRGAPVQCKADPYRYRLPTSEERWRAASPIYDLMKQQAQDLKLPFESLRERKKINAHNAKFLGELD